MAWDLHKSLISGLGVKCPYICKHVICPYLKASIFYPLINPLRQLTSTNLYYQVIKSIKESYQLLLEKVKAVMEIELAARKQAPAQVF